MPEENTKKDSTDFYFEVLLVGLIVIVIALTLLSFFNAGQQAFTELYFAPSSVPKVAVAGQPLAFSFFVENHEGKAINYTYTVSVEGETKTTKTAQLNNGEKRQFSETVVFSATNKEKQKVLVQLQKPGAEKPYEIFFWVSVSS